MISQEWVKKLEALNHQVDVTLNCVASFRSGRAATDFILWESELDTDFDRRWESLW